MYGLQDEISGLNQENRELKQKLKTLKEWVNNRLDDDTDTSGWYVLTKIKKMLEGK